MIKRARAYPQHLMLVEVDKVNKARNLAVVRILPAPSLLLHYLNIIFNILFIILFNILFNILFSSLLMYLNIIFFSASTLWFGVTRVDSVDSYQAELCEIRHFRHLSLYCV